MYITKTGSTSIHTYIYISLLNVEVGLGEQSLVDQEQIHGCCNEDNKDRFLLKKKTWLGWKACVKL